MNKYLEEIASKEKEGNGTNTLKMVAAPVLGFAGYDTVHQQYHRGNLTGRETLYHGASEVKADLIRRNGLKPNNAGVSKIVDPSLHDTNKDIVFTTKSRVHAASYSAQQHAIDSGKITSSPTLSEYQQSKEHAKDLLGNLEGKGTVKINAPTWKSEFKKVRNPELKKQFDYINKDHFGNIFVDKKTRKRAAYAGLEESVNAYKGKEGISNKYIHGSSNYQKNSFSEIKDFAKAKPNRFLKGASKGILGAGLIGAGVYSGISGYKG